ncbi:MAG: hypothetical protein IKN25_04115 [Spirochaetales bacterium]|nr:hypothetical protein [Spirochaetales bacterium]
MKFRVLLGMLLTLMMFIGCDTDTGSSSSSSNKPSAGKTFAVSNIMFDSLTYDLTADVNLAEGTALTLTCSGKSVQTVVKGGKISLSFASLLKGIMGGKSYTVTFAASGYSNATGAIAYWPAVRFNEDLIERVSVYAGAGVSLSEPKLVSNYESDKVKIDVSFSVYDTAEYDSTDDPAKLDVNTTGWTFADMSAFVTNAENTGKTAVYHFTITPNCNNGENLAASGYILYDCKAEVLIESVLINNQSGLYVAKLYAEDNTSDSSKAETAGGTVAYQWQSSPDGSSWTDIAEATAKTFELTGSNVSNLLNKYLRVQVTQTYSGSEQTPIVSPSVKVLHTVVNAALIYDGILKAGEEFDFTKISGTLTDELGKEYNANAGDWTFGKINSYNYTAISSLEFTFACRKDGFNDGRAKAYAVVQASFTESELPSLVSDPYQLSSGKARFAGIDYRLEVSFDSGETYSDMTTDEFAAEVGQTLTLRKKAAGTPGENGYLKESDPLALTVKEENVGKTTQGSGIIGGLELNRIIKSFTLRSLPTDLTIDILPVLDCAENEELTEDTLYEYIWLIDGADPALYNGAKVDELTHALVITKSEFAGDVYQIECRVRIYTHMIVGEDEWDRDEDKGYANMTIDLR